MEIPDAVFRLCGSLPEWARYFVRLGAQSLAAELGLTVVVSVPRRECVAGLIAVGAVLAREEKVWNSLAASPGQDLRVEDRVAVVCEPWCVPATVEDANDTQLKVRLGTDIRTYRDQERCAVVVLRADLSAKEHISPGFRMLKDSIFSDRFRAISFELRDLEGCLVTGPKKALRDEWAHAHVITNPASPLSVGDLLSPNTGGGSLKGFHCRLISDRGESAKNDGCTEGVHIIDGYRGWLKVRRDEINGCRVVVIDRTDDRTYRESLHIVEEDMGDFDAFGNDPEPPMGIETFAYRPPRPAEW